VKEVEKEFINNGYRIEGKIAIKEKEKEIKKVEKTYFLNSTEEYTIFFDDFKQYLLQNMEKPELLSKFHLAEYNHLTWDNDKFGITIKCNLYYYNFHNTFNISMKIEELPKYDTIFEYSIEDKRDSKEIIKDLGKKIEIMEKGMFSQKKNDAEDIIIKKMKLIDRLEAVRQEIREAKLISEKNPIYVQKTNIYITFENAICDPQQIIAIINKYQIRSRQLDGDIQFKKKIKAIIIKQEEQEEQSSQKTDSFSPSISEELKIKGFILNEKGLLINKKLIIILSKYGKIERVNTLYHGYIVEPFDNESAQLLIKNINERSHWKKDGYYAEIIDKETFVSGGDIIYKVYISGFEEGNFDADLNKQSKQKEDSISEGSIESVELIHITDINSLENIKKQGLIPYLSDYTLEAYLRFKENDLQEQGLNFDYEEEYEKAKEELKEMVFACEKEFIFSAISMETSMVKGNSINNIVVLGIKPKYEHLFQKKRIASDIDYISEKIIPIEALIQITDWKEYAKRYGKN
jgi:hypothetical protein